MMNGITKPKLTIVIPAHNEEKTLSRTLQTLTDQKQETGQLIDKNLYQIVIVDNNSTDKTSKVVSDFQKHDSSPRCLLIREPIKGVVAARIAGMNYVLDPKNNLATEFLASGDADVRFHPLWVLSVFRHFKRGDADVLSYAGCYPLDFWKKVPNLVKRYEEDVGTIFFDPPTIDWFDLIGKSFRFTEKIFFDFVRPVTDSCFAIRADAYQKAGGYEREFDDEERKQEIYGEGWRLVFKLEMMRGNIIYVNDVFFNSSPRRLLQEPEKFLGGTSYTPGKMDDLRQRENLSDYDRLNILSQNIDLKPVQRYIVEYYILLKCITRPELLEKNNQYFGELKGKILGDITNWRDTKPFPSGKEIFEFGKILADEYFERLLEIIPEQKVL